MIKPKTRELSDPSVRLACDCQLIQYNSHNPKSSALHLCPLQYPWDASWRQGQCSRGQGQWFGVKVTPSKSAGQAPPGSWSTSPASCFTELMQWQNLVFFPFAECHEVHFPPVGWGELAGTNPPAQQSHRHLGTHPRHHLLSVPRCSRSPGRVCATLLSSSPGNQQALSPCLSPNDAGNPKTPWDLVTGRLGQTQPPAAGAQPGGTFQIKC